MQTNARTLLSGEPKEISMQNVLTYLSEVKQKLDEHDGRTIVSFDFPPAMLKKIQKRMAKKKINQLALYIALLIADDLDTRKSYLSD